MPCKYTDNIIFCGMDGGFTVGRMPKPRRRPTVPDERIDPSDPRLPFDPTAENEAGYRARMACASSDPDTSPITASDGQATEAVVPKNPAENAES